MDKARFVALLAKAARAERDAILGHGTDRDLNKTTAPRGARNPGAALGYDPLPTQSSQLAALRDALGALSTPARSELYVLMRIGQGHRAAKKWYLAVDEAQSLGDATVTGVLLEDPDLHDHVLKGIYEAHLCS